MSTVVLSILAGSRLHGLHTEESDFDIRHIAIPNRIDMCSGRPAQEWDQPGALPDVSVSGETDVGVQFSSEWMWQAIAKGNFNAIELASGPREAFLYAVPFGIRLRDHVLNSCMTTEIATPALGMAKHHLCTVQARFKHGGEFTPKYAKKLREAYRVLCTVSTALRTGFWDPAMDPRSRELCKRIAAAKTPDMAYVLIDAAIQEVKEAVQSSTLPKPHKPAFVRMIIANAHQEIYESKE